MGSEYATNVKSFVTHSDVNARESMDGSSLMLGVGLAAVLIAAVVWWRRRV